MISIRQRLTRSLLLALCLLFGSGLIAIYFMVRAELIKDFDRALLAKAQAISTLVMMDEDVLSLNFSDKFMRGFDDKVAQEFFEIWSRDGVPVQRSESLGESHLPNVTGSFDKPKTWSLKLPNGQPGRALGVEFTPRGLTKPSTRANTSRLYMVVAANSKVLDGDLRNVLIIMSVSGGLLLMLVALLVPWILRRGLRPLVSLANMVERIEAETLSLRLPTEGVPQELQAITDRLNALLLRLERSFERERRVNSAMAHELRTPIAELRNLAECALKWPDDRDPEMDCDVLAIARQMETLVAHMLTLARSETGQLVPCLESVEFNQMIRQAWEPSGRKASAKGCNVTLDLAQISVETDSVLMLSILNNLFENAVEYCLPNGDINIALRASKDGFLLSVANTVVDLTSDDVPHLFERFWRKEHARSGGLHAGLGLSLVHAFACILGCQISARLDDRAVLTITLASLPKP